MTNGHYGYRADPFTGKVAFHQGVDLAAGYGAPILAPADAAVTYAGVKGSFGRVVEIDVGDGVEIRFGHLNAISVKSGDRVSAGQQLGTMGSTGRTTGAHVHLEYLRNGKAYDPLTVENLILATSLQIEPPAALPPSPSVDPAPAPQQTPAQPTPRSAAPPQAVPTQLSPRAPVEMTIIRAPFAARTLSVESHTGGLSTVRLQQVAMSARPVAGEACTATFTNVEYERTSAHPSFIGEGGIIGFAPAASLANAVSCPEPAAAPAPQAAQKIDYRLPNAPHALVNAPARQTSGFGNRMDPFTREMAFHGGIDIASERGAPIHAPVTGTVVRADHDTIYGNVVELEVSGGFVLRMGQLEEIKAKPGVRVRAGDVIGTMGSTGRSTGPHLHFEVLVNGKQIEPELVYGLTLVGN
jgi:murein DD-endopeptidase MepM/ murein hydrolase activator NlpD